MAAMVVTTNGCSLSAIDLPSKWYYAGVIDGLYGPQTDYAVERLVQLQDRGQLRRSFADISPLNSNPDNVPQENESYLTQYYGERGQVPLIKVPVLGI